MKNKILLLILFFFVLTICGACSAANNTSNNSLSENNNNSPSSDEYSYVIVHALNPEGVEISSIQGMQHSVEIFDNGDLIGWGADGVSEPYPARFFLQPGTHDISATFNGMTKGRTINLNPGETKVVSFTFERTAYQEDIQDALSCGSETIQAYSDGYRSGYFSQPSQFSWVGIDATDGSPGYWEAVINSSLSPSLYTVDGYYSLNGNGGGNSYISGGGFSVPVNIPRSDTFNSWYIQGDIKSNPTIDSLRYFIRSDIADPLYHLNYFGDYNNFTNVIPANENYSTIGALIWWEPHFRFAPVITESYRFNDDHYCVSYPQSVNLCFDTIKFSNVPYDTIGTGIKASVADFTYSIEHADDTCGTNILVLDASSSYDPNGAIVSYNWDYGDGQTGAGLTQSHVYQDSGNYIVKLTVTNENGVSNFITKEIEIVQRKFDETTRYQINSTAPGYEVASVDSPYYEYIGNFHLNQNNLPAGASAPGVEFGRDANGKLYIKVNVQVTSGESGHYFGDEYLSVWIDWNMDKIFDYNEMVLWQCRSASEVGYDGTLVFYQDGIDIPLEYLSFKPVNYNEPWPSTYMRVALKYNGSPSATGSWNWGDVEDYKITPYYVMNKEQIKHGAQLAKNILINLKAVGISLDAVTGAFGIISNGKMVSEFLNGLISGDFSGFASEVKQGIPGEITDPTTTVCQGLLDQISDDSITVYDKIINDPPDFNYTTVAELEPEVVVPPMDNTDYDRAIADIFTKLSQYNNIQNALLTSIERYDGAVIDQQTQYIILQAQVIRQYSDMSTISLNDLNSSIEILNSIMAQAETNPLYYQEIQNLKDDLSANGFTVEDITYFHSLGMDDTVIEAYRQNLLNFDPDTPGQNFVQWNNTNTDNLNVYYDLSNQASNLELFQILNSIKEVHPGESIQDVINKALDGNTILVCGNNGDSYTYLENLTIDKKLTIKSGGDGMITVQAQNTSLPVFTITSTGSNSTVLGFNITGSNSCGISLVSASNCIIQSNEVNGNNIGILVLGNQNIIINNIIENNFWAGICADTVNGSQIISNSIMGNQEGIYLLNSYNNQLESNYIFNNIVNGLNIQSGSQNTVNYNYISDNGVNTLGNGVILKNSTQNNLYQNTIQNNGWSGIVLDGSSNNNIGNYEYWGNFISGNNNGLVLYGVSTLNNIEFNTIQNNDYNGLELYWGCDENNITLNNFTVNGVIGILIQYSDNNTIDNNFIENGNYNGIVLDSSSNNHMLNNYINNVGNTVDMGGIGLLMVQNSNQNTINNNEFNGNIWTNIVLDHCTENQITNNTINGNQTSQQGILLLNNSNQNNINNNTISNNTAVGISLQNNSNTNNINQNTVTNNGLIGILLNTSNNNILNHNTLENNGWAGTCLSNSTGNTLTQNNYISNPEQAYDNGTNSYDNGITGNYYNNWNTTDPRPVSGGNNVDHNPNLLPF